MIFHFFTLGQNFKERVKIKCSEGFDECLSSPPRNAVEINTHLKPNSLHYMYEIDKIYFRLVCSYFIKLKFMQPSVSLDIISFGHVKIMKIFDGWGSYSILYLLFFSIEMEKRNQPQLTNNCLLQRVGTST